MAATISKNCGHLLFRARAEAADNVSLWITAALLIIIIRLNVELT